jgi:hypothetical protein
MIQQKWTGAARAVNTDADREHANSPAANLLLSVSGDSSISVAGRPRLTKTGEPAVDRDVAFRSGFQAYCPGDQYHVAYVKAARRGYETGSTAYRAFVEGFFQALKTGRREPPPDAD